MSTLVGETEHKRLEFISRLRVFSMICILLCHFVQEFDNLFITAAAQIFNIGVPVFFIISGFCLGLQGNIGNVRKWYVKRAKRIYIPYEVTLLLYLCVLLLRKATIPTKTWIFILLGMQGSYFDFSGLEHTWFITALILCYIITPIIQKLTNLLSKRNKFIKQVIFILSIALFVLINIKTASDVYVLISPVFLYLFSYVYGLNYKGDTDIKKALTAFAVIVLSCAVRFVSRFWFDETLLYNRVIVNLTLYGAAFGIFKLFEYLFKNAGKRKTIKFAESISFEVYLCHYIFLKGYVPIIRLTDNILINLLLVTLTTILSAYIINKISKFLESKIFMGTSNICERI